MEHRKVMPVLIAILAAACAVLVVLIVTVYRRQNYIPDDTVGSIVSLLDSEGIGIDEGLIEKKKSTGTVYVCSPEEYDRTIAVLLSQSEVKTSYLTPGGEIIITESGSLISFEGDFKIRYERDRNDESLRGEVVGEIPRDSEAWNDAAAAAVDFIARGSRDFGNEENVILETEVMSVEITEAGEYVVKCIRTIDGTEISGNNLTCRVSGGEVTEMTGRWGFLTTGSTYSGELIDVTSVLFTARKDIMAVLEKQASGDVSEETAEPARAEIVSIERCYSMYTNGDGTELYLVPCWKLVTDRAGSFIYNAIDGAYVTNNQ